MTDLPSAPRTGRYLFAVARGLEPEVLRGVEGLRGAPLDVVEHEGLEAVVCTVDLEEFGEGALRQHLEDLAWLEGVARRHNDVVWATAAHATVAPMRLVTICSDD
ncbi:MAG: GvpL/GvpF family gas vesicle protein, partial [Marmoricola sp.]|nr:GvpL/GvpF family gas vesicle protein [Marmoricola sp.]